MSFIINNSDPYISTKLTEKGRERIASGNLNFKYWAIGDSEINYEREFLVENNTSDVTLSATTKLLRPVDDNNDFVSYVYDGNSSLNPFNEIGTDEFKTLKLVVSNKAKERGFFTGDTTSGWNILSGSSYEMEYGILPASGFTGTKIYSGFNGNANVNDYILIRFTNDTAGLLQPLDATTPTPTLWYKIEGITGNTIEVDRAFPNLSGESVDVEYHLYPNDFYSTIYSGDTTAYWDSGTLSFDAISEVTCKDIPIWNMNNIWCEDLAGYSGNTHENYEYFGSYQYLGEKYPFLNYNCFDTFIDTSPKCDGESIIDPVRKSISIIHYTNNLLSNVYGEYFNIDHDNNKHFELYLPTIMYHRRYFSGGNGTGDEMGMYFISTGDVKTIENTNIEYYDLIENPNFIDPNKEPKVVGKVFNKLKFVVIDDDEIVMAMSYKSNRNWTLPPLKANLSSPTSTGVLEQNKTMYLTYIFENTMSSGHTTPLHCQYYTKITNKTSTSRDVLFTFEDLELFPYMRKIEYPTYDGLGFYADKFKILYQIVDDENDRPDPSSWKVADFTSTGITVNANETIDPNLIEVQDPTVNGFIIDSTVDLSATTYNLFNLFDLPLLTEPERLQFGDERIFYGNINTHIGATIFKSIFDIRINSDKFIATTNKTWSSDLDTNIRVSEIGIYDDEQNLVLLGKTSKPIELEPGSTIMVELSIDF
jgi:hypothetical protein